MKVRNLILRPHRIAQLSFPKDGMIALRNADFGDTLQLFDSAALELLLAQIPLDDKPPAETQLGAKAEELLSHLVKGCVAAQDHRDCFVALQQAISKARVVFQSRTRKEGDVKVDLNSVLNDQIKALQKSREHQVERLKEVSGHYDKKGNEELKEAQEPKAISISHPSRTDHLSFPQKNQFSEQTTTIFDDDDDKQGKNVTGAFNTTSASEAAHDRAANPLPANGVPDMGLKDPPPSSFWTGFTATHACQVVTHRSDGEIRSPYRDSQIRFQDELILNSQRLTEAYIRLPSLQAAEFVERQDWLQAVLDVRAKQLDLCDCFILPPFTGRLNQVLKDVGEFARGGDAMFRLEDETSKLVVGRINANVLIIPGQELVITLQSEFEGKETKLSLRMKVLTVRGHDSDNDEWEVVAAAMGDGWAKLPINYTFDRESSSIDLPG